MHRLVLLLLCLMPMLASPALAYIDAPAETLTLPELILEFRSCGIYRIEWVDQTRGAAKYRLTETLNADPPDSVQHLLAIAGKTPSILQGLHVGDSAVFFGPDAFGRRLGFAGGGWFILQQVRSTAWWRTEYTAAHYDFGCAFSGAMPRLVDACKTLLDGDSVAVTCHRKPHETEVRQVTCSLRDPHHVTETKVATAPSAGDDFSAGALSARPVAQLLELLRSPDAQARVACARALGSRDGADARVIDDLLQHLDDADPFVRRAVAIALANQGAAARRAIPTLLSKMRDGYDNESDMAGWAASRAVLKLDPAGSMWLPLLVKQLADDKREVRSKSARAFGILGEASHPATPDLLEASKDPAPQVRREVARSLARIGVDASIIAPRLIELLGDDDDAVRDAASGSLRRLGVLVVNELSTALAPTREVEIRRRAAHLLKQLGDDAAPAASALRVAADDSDERVRSAARDALKNLEPNGGRD